jgi:simple sugar transport system permease protein
MVVGGALAGLGGAIELAGVDGSLRPETMLGFGFVGFLASWLVRHDPLRLLGSSFLLAAIAVGGTGLKIASGLSGGAVNVLMALVLLAVLGWGQRKEVA